MKPFRTPLLKRSVVDENGLPHSKKTKIRPEDLGSRLIFKVSGVSSFPRRPFSDVETAAETIDKSGPKGYYTVLWRKITNKKNKTWEGDALLYVASDGSAELQDSDTSKSIGRTKCHEPLLPGSTMHIAGKDVEVENVLSRDQYLARKKQPVVLATAAKEKESAPIKKPHFVAPVPLLTMPPKIEKEPKKPVAKPVQPPKPPATNILMKSKQARASTSALESLTQQDPEILAMKRTPDAKVDVTVDVSLSKKLRQHQSEGVCFLYECVMGLRDFNGQGAILADEMGLGKTLQMIALLLTLLKQSPSGHGSIIKKALIVCPATLINNWKKEFRKWLGLDRIGVLVADGKSRISHFTHGKSYSVMIVSYEKLRTIQADLAKGQEIDLIVADEAHRLKTAKNKSGQAIKAFPTAMKVLLTGTPLQNDLGEFYELIEMVNPGVLGSLKSFTRDFEVPITRGRQPGASFEDVEEGGECSKELARLTSPFILRRTADVLAKYLPPKTEHVLFCRPTQAQAAVYQQVLASPTFHAAALGNAECPLQLITILKKVCNSPALLKDKTDESTAPDANPTNAALVASIPPHLLRSNAGSTKLRMLDQLLHVIRTTTSEKVVLVSNYTSALDLLGNLLTSVGHTFNRIDGSTPTGKRQDMIDDFNRSSAEVCFAFLLSAKTGGVGINLIGASRLILFDVDWNPATDLQAMARIHRDGQKRPCFIYRFLMAGGIDEKIWQRQIVKLGLASNIMDQKGETSSFTREDLRDLFRLDEGLSCQTHDLIACKCKGRNAEQPEGKKDEDAVLDLPSISSLLENRRIDKEQSMDEVKAVSEVARDTLMAYTHVDSSGFANGCDEDIEALITDEVLLKTLKDEANRTSFVFSKTSA